MIVVTGSAGQLGTAFRKVLGEHARYLTRKDLDLTDRESIRDVLGDLRPSILINCAAYTAVDRAESEPELADAVNAAAVGAMARTMADIEGRFVTFSTDYVFDGDATRPYLESDATEPINVYGRTKRDGELAALDVCPDPLIVRTSWLLSGTHRNFASTMIGLAREGEVAVVDDQIGHPTLVNDLAQATITALEADASGILHLCNTGTTTWFSLAQEIVALANVDPGQIRPCPTSDYPTAARRPENSVIDSERLSAFSLEPLPHYQLGLQQLVSEILSWLSTEY